MGLEGENAPSRQNIKSHLQKYRLMVKKRAMLGKTTPAPGSTPKGMAMMSMSMQRSPQKTLTRMTDEKLNTKDTFSLADLPAGTVFHGDTEVTNESSDIDIDIESDCGESCNLPSR